MPRTGGLLRAAGSNGAAPAKAQQGAPPPAGSNGAAPTKAQPVLHPRSVHASSYPPKHGRHSIPATGQSAHAASGRFKRRCTRQSAAGAPSPAGSNGAAPANAQPALHPRNGSARARRVRSVQSAPASAASTVPTLPPPASMRRMAFLKCAANRMQVNVTASASATGSAAYTAIVRSAGKRCGRM